MNRRLLGLRAGFWAVALSAVLVGCGGGQEPMAGAPAAAPVVLKVDGFTRPADADAGVSPIQKRGATLAPVPAHVTLGPLEQDKMQPLAQPGRRLVGVAREVAATRNASQTQQQLNWTRTASGGLVAAMAFSSEGAHGLRLGVAPDQLPGSAQLRVYSPNDPATVFQISGQEVLQRIQRNADAGDRSLEGRTWWTPDFGSDAVTLEVELPPGTPAAAVALSVPRVSHVFENLSIPTQDEVQAAKINESASCQLDATCYDTYASQRNAVARMIFTSGGSSFVCTGTLLNDSQASGTPYFLTANHCISTQAEASSVQTDWFYRSPTCNSRTLSSATTKRFNGAALLNASSSTDVTLLRLNDAPPAGAFYAGWDANAQGAGTSVVGLHHPKGDLLKVSFGSVNSYSNCTSASGSQFQCSGTSGNFYRVSWTQGTTEGGSSGSALFKGGTHVIGTLYGGSATCTAQSSPDFYGRFDVAYNAALKQWLSPTVSNAGRTAIYRFYNSQTGAHFFTSSAAERDFVIQTYPQFAYENIAFYAYAAPTAGQSTVFRFYNTGNGAHFYTISQAESLFVQATYPAFRYEGPIWYAQEAGGNGSTAIYRFYRPATGAHFYTINQAERDFVIANYKDFQYEGVAYYGWTSN